MTIKHANGNRYLDAKIEHNRFSCCTSSSSLLDGYLCPTGKHSTCRLHLYIDSEGNSYCYLCMAQISESSPSDIKIYKGSEDPKNLADHVVLIMHALHACGAVRHGLELAQELRRRNFFVTVLAIQGGGHWAHKFLTAANKIVLASPYITWNELSSIISWKKPKFVTAHHDPAISWAVREVPTSITLYSHFHTEPNYASNKVSVLNIAAKRCKRIFFPSEQTRRAYSKEIDEDKFKKCEILPNALPIEMREADWKRNICESIERTPPHYFHIAVVSRLDRDKFSTSLFINTLKKVNETSQFKVIVAGSGEISHGVRYEVSRSGMGDIIEFVGFVDDIGQIYKWADIVFIPSYTEAMPYTAIEAIAGGLPCVLPHIGYFADYASAGSHILTFAIGDHVKAAELLICSLAGNYSENGDLPYELTYDNWSKHVGDLYELERL